MSEHDDEIARLRSRYQAEAAAYRERLAEITRECKTSLEATSAKYKADMATVYSPTWAARLLVASAIAPLLIALWKWALS